MDQNDPIRYDLWLEEALRSVARRALEHTRDHGLPGDHHFYITFSTRDNGVDIPDHLRALHPDDMTIVLQHQFDDLVIDDVGFAVTLRFSGRACRMIVPFSAVTAFADPSVNFGLQMRMVTVDEDGDVDDEDLDDMADFDVMLANSDSAGEPSTAEVITLDAFRKK